MSLTARIIDHGSESWLIVEASPLHLGGDPLIVYDAPVDVSTKQTIRSEIDWAHDKTGMPRPDLYDAFRAYQAATRRRAPAA